MLIKKIENKLLSEVIKDNKTNANNIISVNIIALIHQMKKK